MPLVTPDPIVRRCFGCGEPFTPSRKDQIRCEPHCSVEDRHKPREDKRTGRYQRAPREFIAVDGEGITLDSGAHHYVLLSVGDNSLHHNGEPLAWEDVFSFLWENYLEHPTAIYVGFYLGYDFAQWFKTLPEERARMLLTAPGQALRKRTASPGNHTPFPVRYKDWEFDTLPHRHVKLRKAGERTPWMYVCDSGSFFQTSFLTAINPEKWPQPICTSEEYETIKAGKQERDTAVFDPAMIRYNITENTVMSRLMENFAQGLDSIGVTLDRSRWFGPGQAANKWLQRTSCIERDELQVMIPEQARTIARKTYYGGWFEIRRHGHISGRSWQYDINSAYPRIISRLPCLRHGKWTRFRYDEFLDMEVVHPYTMVHAELTGPGEGSWFGGTCAPFGPAPHRMAKTNQILRPLQVRGWYWLHEIMAAQRAGLIHHMTFPERDRIIALRYDPCDCAPPLAGVADLYQERLRIGKDTPTGKAAKLVYNSIYGKFAQSVGQPRWANPIYASLITAGTRVQILDALASHPDGARACSMIATDSVTFDAPHPYLTISDKLGEWSVKELDNLCLFMPGMYWDDNARERVRTGKSIAFKSRGIRGEDLQHMIEQIDEAFASWAPELGTIELPRDWPSFDIPVRFALVTCEQALSWGRWEDAGSVIRNGTRHVSANAWPKRAVLHRDDRGIWSEPWRLWSELDTRPYDKSFGEEVSAEAITPDHSNAMQLVIEGIMG